MQQMNPTTAAQQIHELSQQLNRAFVQKDEAQAALEQADITIRALRNVMAGVQLGQSLQKEIDAPKVAAAVSPPPPAATPLRASEGCTAHQ